MAGSHGVMQEPNIPLMIVMPTRNFLFNLPIACSFQTAGYDDESEEGRP